MDDLWSMYATREKDALSRFKIGEALAYIKTVELECDRAARNIAFGLAIVAAYAEGVTVRRSTSPTCAQCNLPLAVSVERLCWSCACWEEKTGGKR